MKRIISLSLVFSTILGFAGCMGKYKVSCTGRSFFQGLKSSYSAGAEVKFSCPAGTDETLFVYLDSQRLSPGTADEKGNVTFSFTMPAHDVEITWESVNTMVNTVVTDTDALREGTFLFGYYDAITGTEIPRGYYEIVMTYLTEETVKADVYDTTDNPEQKTSKSYIVSYSAYTDVLNAALGAKMDKWESLKNGNCIDGGYYLCRFRTADGKIACATSDNMPSDGQMKFSTIKVLLESCIANGEEC